MQLDFESRGELLSVFWGYYPEITKIHSLSLQIDIPIAIVNIFVPKSLPKSMENENLKISDLFVSFQNNLKMA